jgi:hypothetical protein
MEPFYRLEARQRIALAREAHEDGTPLMARWADMLPDFGDRWEHRAALAAVWLADAASVADLGCGTMTLERHLRRDQAYHPVDIAARDERTVVRNLNDGRDLARLPRADACTLLGVLEYSYVPDALFAALRATYARAVLSFNVRADDDAFEQRLEHGWVNHFTYGELIAMFARHRLAARYAHLFEGRRREYLFDLRRVDG